MKKLFTEISGTKIYADLDELDEWTKKYLKLRKEFDNVFKK